MNRTETKTAISPVLSTAGLEADPEWYAQAQNALDRMRRAHYRGTGCHLTADMIQGLSVSLIGSMWEEPRTKQAANAKLTGLAPGKDEQ
jgi:hypothetical protein